MRRVWRVGAALLGGLVLLAGCGSDTGGGGETAVLTGTLEASEAARTAARAVADSGQGTYYVEAVDETGTTRDAAQGLRPGDTFELRVPPGHVYVVVVGDDRGVIGGVVYDPDAGRSDFEIPEGVERVVLGIVVVDPVRRRAEVRGHPEGIRPPHSAPPEDNDGDHIPDFADRDDDNDGIEDHRDRSGEHDYSRDHDNDGMEDADDPDDDNDGVPDDEDRMGEHDRSRDHDNDGHDGDRHMELGGDPETGAQVYADNGCGTCHGADGSSGGEPIRNVSAHELAEVLLKGEDEDEGGMPAFPDLVPFAADLAAFLSGEPAGVPDSGGDSGAGNPSADTGGGSSDTAPPQDTPTPPNTEPPQDTTPPQDSTPPADTPPAADGQAVFDNVCAACHRLGSYDTAGFAPDLSGKGAMVSGTFGAGAMHMGNTLTDAEIQAVGAFLDAN